MSNSSSTVISEVIFVTHADSQLFPHTVVGVISWILSFLTHAKGLKKILCPQSSHMQIP